MISHLPSCVSCRNLVLFSTVLRLKLDSFSKVESDWFKLFSRKNWMINLITLSRKIDCERQIMGIDAIYVVDILFLVNGRVWHFDLVEKFSRRKRDNFPFENLNLIGSSRHARSRNKSAYFFFLNFQFFFSLFSFFFRVDSSNENTGKNHTCWFSYFTI